MNKEDHRAVPAYRVVVRVLGLRGQLLIRPDGILFSLLAEDELPVEVVYELVWVLHHNAAGQEIAVLGLEQHSKRSLNDLASIDPKAHEVRRGMVN